MKRHGSASGRVGLLVLTQARGSSYWKEEWIIRKMGSGARLPGLHRNSSLLASCVAVSGFHNILELWLLFPYDGNHDSLAPRQQSQHMTRWDLFPVFL